MNERDVFIRKVADKLSEIDVYKEVIGSYLENANQYFFGMEMEDIDTRRLDDYANSIIVFWKV